MISIFIGLTENNLEFCVFRLSFQEDAKLLIDLEYVITYI
jgi:hypothetical protein